MIYSSLPITLLRARKHQRLSFKKRIRIVITEDNRLLQIAFRLVFNPREYDLTIYSSGNSILTSDFAIPDVFILDKETSGIIAHDLCIHLKRQPETKNVPVIIISKDPKVANYAMNANADDYLQKPFPYNALLAAISKVLVKDK